MAPNIVFLLMEVVQNESVVTSHGCLVHIVTTGQIAL